MSAYEEDLYDDLAYEDIEGAADLYDEFDEFDEFDAYDEDDEFDDFDLYDEDDEFIKDAWRWLTKKGSTQRRIALSAAKNALVGGLGAIGGALGGKKAGQAGTIAGGTGGALLGGALAGLLPDQMDYLADLAAESDDEDEADEFLSALVPLASRLLPTAAKAIGRVAPQLISGVSRVARSLHRNPATRQMIRQLPNIVRNTTRDVARQYAKTGRISGKTAARMLSKRTYQGLRKPKPVKRLLQRPPTRRPMPVRTKGKRSRIIRTPRGYCRCYTR